MKNKNIKLAISLALTTLSLPALADIQTINLYAGGSDNTRHTLTKVIEAFEKKNANIKVNLEFLPSGTGGVIASDRVIAAYQAKKHSGIDVMETSEGDIANIINKAGIDALTPLTEKEIPNLKNVIAKTSTGENYAVPFRGTTVVLAYNNEVVKDVPTTTQELHNWIKNNPQRFTYCEPGTGGSGESFLVTSIYNELPEEALVSPDVKWKQQWNKGFELLEDLHPYMYETAGKVHYPFKNQGALDLLAMGEIDMTPMWADMVLDQKARGMLPENIEIAQLDPAFNGSLMTFTVPSDSEKKEAAQKFIDFSVSIQGQEIFVKEQKAIPVISPSLLSNDIANSLNGLEMSSYRTYSIGDLKPELMREWANKIAPMSK